MNENNIAIFTNSLTSGEMGLAIKSDVLIKAKTWNLILKIDINDISNQSEFTPHSLIQIKSADLIILIVENSLKDFEFEIGIVAAFEKPVLVFINTAAWTNYKLFNFRYSIYESDYYEASISRFVESIHAALIYPQPYFIFEKTQSKINPKTVFVSYSHADDQYLKRLLIHLRPLEFNKSIIPWSDKMIDPGDMWKIKIAKALEESSIAILLVSADFLASPFIVENELQPLLQAAKTKNKKIIPVILKPCGYLRDPILREIQAVNNPTTPLSGMFENGQEEIWDQIANQVFLILRSE